MKDLMPSHSSWSTVALGTLPSNEEIIWDINDNSHLIFIGSAGSGKTNIETLFVNHCLRYPEQWEFLSLCPGQHTVEVDRFKSRVRYPSKIVEGIRAATYELEELVAEFSHRSLYRRKSDRIENVKDPRKGKKFKSILVSIPLLGALDDGRNTLAQAFLRNLEILLKAPKGNGIYIIAAGQRHFNLLRPSIPPLFEGIFALGNVSSTQEQIMFKGFSPKTSLLEIPSRYTSWGRYKRKPISFIPYRHTPLPMKQK